jgi:hypothetical protein
MKPKRITARERELLCELLCAGRCLISAAMFIRSGAEGPFVEVFTAANDCFDLVFESLKPGKDRVKK